MSVFELVADSYERYRKPRVQIIDHITNYINKSTLGDARILDLGCGTGGYASKLGEIFDTIIYGVDLSDAMIKKASKKKHVQTIKCDCNESIVIPKDHFDGAYCINFIHYIRNLDNFLSSIFRTLRKEGVIYIATHKESDIRQQSLGRYFPSTIPIELSMIHSIKSVTSSLLKNGFSNVRVESVNIRQPLDEEFLNACKTKSYNCLHSIDSDSFAEGIERIEKDINNLSGEGCFPYTVITGVKHG